MALYKIKNTRRLILLFVAISVILAGISTASLLYLNHTINRLSDSLYSDVYQNSELILNADRDLHQAALALHTVMNRNITREQRGLLSQEFHDNNAQVKQRLGMVSYNINAMNHPEKRMTQSNRLLSQLRNELLSFEDAFESWKNTGQKLISRRMESNWNPDTYSAIMINTRLSEVRSSLDQSENLIDNYGQQITQEFRERKSTLFAAYSLILFLLMLVIIYLCRRVVSLQSEMQEDQSLYQLIGETISDFIILTDPNGMILYASPSHSSVLGYVPDKDVPLPTISAKLKSPGRS